MHNQVLRQILIEVRPDAYNEVQQKKKEAEITILHISGCFFASVFVQFNAPIYFCIPCLPTLVFLSEMLLNFVFFGILVRRSYQTGVFFTLCHIGYLFRF